MSILSKVVRKVVSGAKTVVTDPKKAVKELGKNVGGALELASKGAGVIPGLGTLTAPAAAALGSVLEGHNLTNTLKEAGKAAIPLGSVAGAARQVRGDATGSLRGAADDAIGVAPQRGRAQLRTGQTRARGRGPATLTNDGRGGQAGEATRARVLTQLAPLTQPTQIPSASPRAFVDAASGDAAPPPTPEVAGETAAQGGGRTPLANADTRAIDPGDDLRGTAILPGNNPRLDAARGASDAASAGEQGYDRAGAATAGRNVARDAIGNTRVEAGPGVTTQTGARTAAARQRLDQADNQIANGPNRTQLATQTLDALDAAGAKGFQQRLRQVGQSNAALGRLGSGMVRDDLKSALDQIELEKGAQRAQLAQSVSEGDINDRFRAADTFGSQERNTTADDVRAAEEARGERAYRTGIDTGNVERSIDAGKTALGYGASEADAGFGQRRAIAGDAAAREGQVDSAGRADREEYRGERGYEGGLADQAKQDAVNQAVLEDQFKTSAVHRGATLADAGYAGNPGGFYERQAAGYGDSAAGNFGNAAAGAAERARSGEGQRVPPTIGALPNVPIRAPNPTAAPGAPRPVASVQGGAPPVIGLQPIQSEDVAQPGAQPGAQPETQPLNAGTPNTPAAPTAPQQRVPFGPPAAVPAGQSGQPPAPSLGAPAPRVAMANAQPGARRVRMPQTQMQPATPVGAY